jgi:hypothetical protein
MEGEALSDSVGRCDAKGWSSICLVRDAVVMGLTGPICLGDGTRRIRRLPLSKDDLSTSRVNLQAT